MAFFTLVFVLSYLKDNQPVFNNTNSTLLIALFILLSVVLLIVALAIAKNGIGAELFLAREKFKKRSHPFILSIQPKVDHEALIIHIKSTMEATGYKVTENVNLFPKSEVSALYKSNRDGTDEYIFLIISDNLLLGDMDLDKV